MEKRPKRQRLSLELCRDWTYQEWKLLFGVEIRDTDSLTVWLRTRLYKLDKWRISRTVLGYLIAWYNELGEEEIKKRIQKLLLARRDWKILKKRQTLRLVRQEGRIEEEEKKED